MAASGGADYDGDMVKVIYEPVICESIASHYKETDKLTADRFANEYNLPLLNIPTAKPQMRDANDWYARFECVKSAFSSRVGQISNAALDRSMIAYKIYDSKGYVVESGNLFINGIGKGDKFKDDSISVYDITPGDAYKIVFSEYHY